MDSNYIISKLGSAGVPSGNAQILAAIAYAESSYNTAAIGDAQYGYSIGLFQINLPAHSDKLARWTSSQDKNTWVNWLSNADNNIFAATQVYFSQGLGAWSTYNDGSYLKYLGQNYTVTIGSISSKNNDIVAQFIDTVRAQLGKPYVWGAIGPDSFDCSGLVDYVWGKIGVQISRTADLQWQDCNPLGRSRLQVGDLLFSNFDASGLPNHVGIFIGNDTVVAAPHAGANVTEYGLSNFGSFRAGRHPGMASALGSGAANYSGGLFSQNPVLNVPSTNYQVITGSGASGDKLFGRRYRVIASDPTGNKALDVSQLHCTFQVVKTMMVQPNYSHVVIYNLSPETENAIINEGYRLVIEAGYVGSQYGLIFDGNVIQPIRDKPDGTTYTLTLVSMDSDAFLVSSVANFSVIRGQNSRALIGQVASSASIPSELGNISPNLSGTQLTRGRVFFGKAADILRQVAQSESATYYMEDGKVNILRADDYPVSESGGEIIDLTPETGLIGVPAQQDYGATIKMLLNPRVKIGSLVHIDNSLIRNQQYQTGQAVYALDKDGIYRVIKLTHQGDTRGEPWFTEVETVSQAGILPSMVSSGNSNPW